MRIYDPVQNVSVSWLMRNITDSCDIGGSCYESGLDFDDLFDSKLDASFMRLWNTIPDVGFNVPICVELMDDGETWRLGNGHHRFSFAILFALDTIPVVFSFGDHMVNEYTTPRGSTSQLIRTDYDDEDLNWLRDQFDLEWLENGGRCDCGCEEPTCQCGNCEECGYHCDCCGDEFCEQGVNPAGYLNNPDHYPDRFPRKGADVWHYFCGNECCGDVPPLQLQFRYEYPEPEIDALLARLFLNATPPF